MKIVILGAGYAGLTTAIRLSKRSAGRAEITLVNARDELVERIRLHEHAAGDEPEPQPIADFLRGTGVRLEVGYVDAVDLEARTLSVRRGGAMSRRDVLAWDRLVLALGSTTDTSVPGASEHAMTLEGAGAAALSARIGDLAAKLGRVLVVGGGLTGIEAATELAESWPALRVTLVTRGRVAEGFSDAAREHVLRACARLGVEVKGGTQVLEVGPGGLATNQGVLPFDVCLWALGFVATPLPSGLELSRNARGQVLVDPYLRSIDDPHVYVAGDLASPVEPPGLPLPMGCKSAAPAGAHVAESLAAELRGEREQPFDFAAPGYCVSLGRKDGLVQLARADGSLEGVMLRGRLAAWVKELVCRTTLLALRFERSFGRVPYEMLRSGRVKALPAGAARSTPTDAAA
jgi:NADH dehydrogenase FAD-containing subunit